MVKKTKSRASSGTKQSEIEKEEREIIHQIAENYMKLEESITSQLNIAVKRHHVTSGTFREDIWKGMFEQIIPHKFSIEQSVFIIDSKGRVSKEVDLAIFDEQYTPYIFRHGRIKYIPIEAVAVVIQCKSRNVTSQNDKKILREWSRSIDRLETSLKSITRTQAGIITGEYECLEDKEGNLSLQGKVRSMTQTSTRPIQILCHIHNKKDINYSTSFDFNIHPDHTGTKLRVRVSPELTTLPQWNNHLNHKDNSRYGKLKNTDFKDVLDDEAEEHSEEYKKALEIKSYKVAKGSDEIALLSLTFQLNQLLMLINNPILFPHKAYVDMFNDKLSMQ